MKSAKCYECGFVGWDDVEFCKKCGAAMQQRSADAGGAYPAGQVQRNRPAGSRVVYHGELKQSLAICSLVLGIVSFMTFGGLFIGAAAGITFGIIALVKANRYPAEFGGKGLATAGIISSILSLVIIVPIMIIAAIAVPNLLASRRAANEGSSIAVIRRIFAAESTYQAVHGEYADLNQLAAEHLIEPDLVARPRFGYRFTVIQHSDPQGFELTAVPESYPNSGVRSFYIDETGVIRAANRHGAEATKLEPPLADSSSPYRRPSDPGSADQDE